MDAVDEMAQQEFYREQAAILERRSCDMLYLLDEIIGEMTQIFLVNGVWAGIEPDRLYDLFEALRQELEREESTVAIMAYLPEELWNERP